MNLNVKELRLQKGFSQQELSKRTGIPVGRINNWEQGKGQPKFEDRQKLIEFFELSDKSTSSKKHTSESKTSLRVNTEQSSGNTDNSRKEKSSEVVYILTETVYVPLVNQYAYAGYMAGYSDPEYIESLTKIPWEVEREGKGNYRSFEVRGDSMDDGSIRSYPAGTIVLGREVQRHHWQTKLNIDRYRFVIIHREKGILIKQIIKHDVLKGEITIHSYNPEYEDQVLNLNDVAQIFNVLKRQLDF